MMRVRTLPVNEKGRDFVCGDLHGCIDLLNAFMQEVEFDPQKDRLISVGDLIDRGPKSEQCLQLVNKPWFFSIAANHEQMMLEFYNETDEYFGHLWFQNGGKWALQYLESDDMVEFTAGGKWLEHLINTKVFELPHLITVNMQNGKKFHVIHAELPCIVGLTDEMLAPADTESSHVVEHDDFANVTDDMMWHRTMFSSISCLDPNEHTINKVKKTLIHNKYNLMFSDKLSHIYSEHTIMQQPTRILGQTNLDTGAFLRYTKNIQKWSGLTVTEPLTDRFWTVNIDGVQETKPLVIMQD